MKALRVPVAVFLCALGLEVSLAAQQGPKSDSSTTVARPRKPSANGTAPATEPDQPKIPSKFGKAKDGEPAEGGATFRSDAITVTVDTAVLDNKGHFIPSIPKENFRVLEDGVPQQVTGVTVGDAPMTVAVVIEFSAAFQQYYSWGWFQTLSSAYGFLETLKPDDYAAVIAYDMRTEILTDFTTDRSKLNEAMQRLRIPGFSESNLFDALVDTATRMQDVEGRKAILLISSGLDTFSKLTFDKTRRALQDAGVPIYAIGLLQAQRETADALGALDSIARMDFLQADNQLRTFANETGGMSFFPRFEAEVPGIFQNVTQALRSNYVLTYNPSNQARDGKVRRIKVELINPQTHDAVRINDDKGKAIKYKVVAKPGYTAPREVE